MLVLVMQLQHAVLIIAMCLPHAMLTSAMQLPHGCLHYIYKWQRGCHQLVYLIQRALSPPASPAVVLLALYVAASTVCDGTTCSFALI